MLTAMPAAILVAPVIAASAQEWEMDEFMISLWGGPTDEATAAALADAHFNTVMCGSGQLDLCRQHGLKALVMDATPETAAALADDPAVWGFYVQDEPKAEEFEAAGERMAAFHAAAPGRPGYVNLMAWMDLGQYLRTVRP